MMRSSAHDVTPDLSLPFTLWVWSCVALHSLLLFTLTLAALLLLVPLWDRRRRVFMWLERAWAAPLTHVPGFYRARLEGLERLGDSPSVLVSNHQSVLDLLLIYRLPVPFRTVIKRELLRSPLGLNLWLGGHIVADRARRAESERIFEQAKAWLDRGVSVLIFPEGSRSRDARLKRFRRGAFELACRAGVPVTPVVIEGSGGSAPPGTLRFRPGRRLVTLRVLPPIPSEGLTSHALRSAAREAIQASLDTRCDTSGPQ